MSGPSSEPPAGPSCESAPGPSSESASGPSFVTRVAEDPADREACFAVRKEVFVVEQGVPEDIEYDAYDAVALHVLAVHEDGTPLGTGRLLHGAAAAAKTGGDAGSAPWGGWPSPGGPAGSAAARPWCGPSRGRHARGA